jgi:mRNA interferase MazF
VKNFQKWIKLCKSLENKEINLNFREREIRWCHWGANIGCEQDGKNERFERPVLIIKKINRQLFWALPLTTKYKGESYKFCIGKINGEYNYVLLDQIRSLSAKRLKEKLIDLNIKFFKQIQKITFR